MPALPSNRLLRSGSLLACGKNRADVIFLYSDIAKLVTSVHASGRCDHAEHALALHHKVSRIFFRLVGLFPDSERVKPFVTNANFRRAWYPRKSSTTPRTPTTTPTSDTVTDVPADAAFTTPAVEADLA